MRLAEPITLEELKRAIDKGPRYKARGADSIVHEFYVHFWDVIKRTFGLYTLRSYKTEISTQHKPLARLPVCRSVSHRVPSTTTVHYCYAISIKKLWSCLRANAFNDPR